MIGSIDSSQIENLLYNYRYLEEEPIRKLELQKTSIDDRISLFGSLKSKLKSLESLVKELSYTDSTSVFGSKKLSMSSEDYFSATVTSTAIATPHTISVEQLAKADKIVSNKYTLDDTSLATGFGAGTQTFEITVNGEVNEVSVDLDGTEDNEQVLNKIRDAVNGVSGIDVKASIIKDSETSGRLVFNSESTGLDFKMSLTDTGGILLSTIGMNDSVKMSGDSGGYIYESTELNARLTIDGIAIERNTNSIEDAIQGVTLKLTSTHQVGDPPVTLNVESNADNIREKIDTFIEKYNEVMTFIQDNTKVNTSTYERSKLSGDFAVTNLKLQLRNLISSPITGLEAGNASTLAQLGITTDRTGKLSVSDSDQLTEYIESNLSQVTALFTAEDGYATRFEEMLDDYTDGDGIIEKRKEVLQGQIKLINGRVDRLNTQVDRKIEAYRNQFSQLQAAYATFQSQSSYLSALTQISYAS